MEVIFRNPIRESFKAYRVTNVVKKAQGWSDGLFLLCTSL